MGVDDQKKHFPYEKLVKALLIILWLYPSSFWSRSLLPGPDFL